MIVTRRGLYNLCAMVRAVHADPCTIWAAHLGAQARDLLQPHLAEEWLADDMLGDTIAELRKEFRRTVKAHGDQPITDALLASEIQDVYGSFRDWLSTGCFSSGGSGAAASQTSQDTVPTGLWKEHWGQT